MSLEDQRLIMKSDREVRKILTYDFFLFSFIHVLENLNYASPFRDWDHGKYKIKEFDLTDKKVLIFMLIKSLDADEYKNFLQSFRRRQILFSDLFAECICYPVICEI